VQVTKGYVSALLETLADPEGGVREASAEALATLFKFLGEAKVMPFMPDLDNLKLEKIKVSLWN
jgi:cytoskeleton-associated protein 5